MDQLPVIEAREEWQDVLRGGAAAPLAQVLPAYLVQQRWFRSKARPIRATSVIDKVPAPEGLAVILALLQVDYVEGPSEIYLLPLACASGAQAEALARCSPELAVCQVRRPQAAALELLYQPLGEPALAQALLTAMREGASWRGHVGTLVAGATAALASEKSPVDLPVRLVGVEQSNTSVIYGERWILKLYRRLEEGLNPDLEIGRFLVAHAPSAPVPQVGGWLEHLTPDGARSAVGLLQRFVKNQGDAWRHAEEHVQRYLAQAAKGGQAPAPVRGSLLAQAAMAVPPAVEQALGGYLDTAMLLGRRVAELHLALASAPDDPAFTPEPFSPAEQEALAKRMGTLADQTFALLRAQEQCVPPTLRAQAARVLQSGPRLAAVFSRLREQPLRSLRIRHHGDLHLGQILFTGEDFAFIDFEGEPARPLAERRAKQSALRDIAGMLRSFHYAAFAPLLCADLAQAALEQAMPWAVAWQSWSGAAFLRAYLASAGRAAFLPADPEELGLMLDVLVLEKAVYELSYELNNRPTWLGIPLDAIERITNG